jgi:hypothetical protein
MDSNGLITSGVIDGRIDGTVVVLKEERFVQIRTLSTEQKEAIVFNGYIKIFQVLPGIAVIIKNWDDGSCLRIVNEGGGRE